MLRGVTLAGSLGNLAADSGSSNCLPLEEVCGSASDEQWTTDTMMDTNCNLTAMPTLKNDNFMNPTSVCNSMQGKFSCSLTQLKKKYVGVNLNRTCTEMFHLNCSASAQLGILLRLERLRVLIL